MYTVYALSAYPLGKLADTLPPGRLLAEGLLLLIGADLVLAYGPNMPVLFVGIALWGLHMGATQGLLATLVANTAPEDLRGTAFGCFNLLSGLALLVASALAGWLWEQLGPAATFQAGALFGGLALAGLLVKPVAEHKAISE